MKNKFINKTLLRINIMLNTFNKEQYQDFLTKCKEIYTRKLEDIYKTEDLLKMFEENINTVLKETYIKKCKELVEIAKDIKNFQYDYNKKFL